MTNYNTTSGCYSNESFKEFTLSDLLAAANLFPMKTGEPNFVKVPMDVKFEMLLQPPGDFLFTDAVKYVRDSILRSMYVPGFLLRDDYFNDPVPVEEPNVFGGHSAFGGFGVKSIEPLAPPTAVMP